MDRKIVLFPADRSAPRRSSHAEPAQMRRAPAPESESADEIALAKRALADLQTTQMLTTMTADAIAAMDLERMIAIRDPIAAPRVFTLL